MAKEIEINNPDDKGYKYLLAIEDIFMQLLDTFVKEKWVEEIHSGKMIKLDKSYVLEDFKKKESDLVYRLKLKGKDIIFYVLLELQSTVDFLMPYRLKEYMGEIWRDVIKNTPDNIIDNKDFRLPPIVPIVLYNGSGKWTACMSFKEILSEYKLFGEYVLDFKYILIDVNSYSKEELIEVSNLISAVFLADQSMSENEFLNRIGVIGDIIRKQPKRLAQEFKEWFDKIAMRELSKEFKEEALKVLEGDKPKEVRAMLQVFEEVKLRSKREGKMEGKREGEREGEIRGEIRGKSIGKKEKAREVAWNMLIKGLSAEFIAEVTGITIEEVEAIIDEMDG